MLFSLTLFATGSYKTLSDLNVFWAQGISCCFSRYIYSSLSHTQIQIHSCELTHWLIKLTISLSLPPTYIFFTRTWPFLPFVWWDVYPQSHCWKYMEGKNSSVSLSPSKPPNSIFIIIHGPTFMGMHWLYLCVSCCCQLNRFLKPVIHKCFIMTEADANIWSSIQIGLMISALDYFRADIFAFTTTKCDPFQVRTGIQPHNAKLFRCRKPFWFGFSVFWLSRWRTE